MSTTSSLGALQNSSMPFSTLSVDPKARFSITSTSNISTLRHQRTGSKRGMSQSTSKTSISRNRR